MLIGVFLTLSVSLRSMCCGLVLSHRPDLRFSPPAISISSARSLPIWKGWWPTFWREPKGYADRLQFLVAGGCACRAFQWLLMSSSFQWLCSVVLAAWPRVCLQPPLALVVLWCSSRRFFWQQHPSSDGEKRWLSDQSCSAHL